MTRVAAVTILRSEDEVRRLWPATADVLPPLGEQVALTAAPGNRGTEVRVSYDEGGLGDRVKAVIGKDPSREIEDALRRLKQVLETGQVVRSDGSPGGTDATQQRQQQAAKPPATP